MERKNWRGHLAKQKDRHCGRKRRSRSSKNTDDVQRPRETKKRKGKIILFRRGRRGGKRWKKWQLVDYLFVQFPMVPRLLSAALQLACRLSVALN